MADIQPFRGIRPRPELAAQVASPPYDVVDRAEAKAMVVNAPHSFLRVIKPEIELADAIAADDLRVYARGAENLRRMQQEGVLVRDEAPCFYLYKQRMGEHEQVGVVAGASVAEYDADGIKKHELTRAKKEDERTRHVDTLQANTGPVFLTYPASTVVDGLVSRLCAAPADVDFVSEDGIGHTLWVIADGRDVAALQAAFGDIDALYVADGHHRSAAASRVCALRRRQHGASAGGPWDWFLSVIFPHNQMKILPYNRVVLDLNGLTPEALIAAIGERFDVALSEHAAPTQRHHFGMYLAGHWYTLSALEGTFPADDPVASLDVAILQDNLLRPLLDIGDPRTSDRIDFVGGIRGTGELEARADASGGVAFAMYPTSIEELMAIADAGAVMPPKSTWFEPKLRSGMVVRSIEEPTC